MITSSFGATCFCRPSSSCRAAGSTRTGELQQFATAPALNELRQLASRSKVYFHAAPFRAGEDGEEDEQEGAFNGVLCPRQRALAQAAKHTPHARRCETLPSTVCLSLAGAVRYPWALSPLVPLDSLPSHARTTPGGEPDDDEAFARALQEQEAREFHARLLAMAGIVPGTRPFAPFCLPSPLTGEPVWRPALRQRRCLRARPGAAPEDGGDEEDEEGSEAGGVDVDAMSYEACCALPSPVVSRPAPPQLFPPAASARAHAMTARAGRRRSSWPSGRRRATSAAPPRTRRSRRSPRARSTRPSGPSAATRSSARCAGWSSSWATCSRRCRASTSTTKSEHEGSEWPARRERERDAEEERAPRRGLTQPIVPDDGAAARLRPLAAAWSPGCG